VFGHAGTGHTDDDTDDEPIATGVETNDRTDDDPVLAEVGTNDCTDDDHMLAGVEVGLEAPEFESHTPMDVTACP
jgi:hypothetical protein